MLVSGAQFLPIWPRDANPKRSKGERNTGGEREGGEVADGAATAGRGWGREEEGE